MENQNSSEIILSYRPPHPDSSAFLVKTDPLKVHGNHLPHWNQEDKYVFFTFRLSDSLPEEKRDELKSMINTWMANHPKPWDEATKKEYTKLISQRVEKLLDNGYGSCMLRNVEAAKIIEGTMQYDDGKKYQLIDYVVMPNHVHVLVKLMGKITDEALMQEWKSISSHRLRKVYGKRWCGWMEKYFDRHIRNEIHYFYVIDYIAKNYTHGGILRKTR